MFWKLVRLPFRVLMALSKGVLVVLFLAALVLVVAAVTSDQVFDRVSSMVEAVSPNATVRVEQQRLLQSETDRANSEGKRAKAAVDASNDLKERNQALSQNNDALQATNAALKQQNDALTQANGGLDAQIKSLKAELANPQVTYQGKTIAAREAVSEATNDLATRIAAQAARRSAAITGAAVPYFGLPVLSANASKDIEDDCAALRSLQALNLAFDPKSTLDDGGTCALQIPDAQALWQGVSSDTQGVLNGLSTRFAGVVPVTLPIWWDMIIGWGNELMPTLPVVTVKQ